jgi:hypothetical protein
MVEFDALKKLRATCDGCKETTIKSYHRTLKRLAKIAGHDSIPSNKIWLVGDKGKALIRELNKLPVTKSRHLFLAGAHGHKMYTGKRDTLWTEAMNDSSLAYSNLRAKNQKSQTEKDNWPKLGFRSLRAAATILKKRYKALLDQKTPLSAVHQYDLQKYIVMLLYSHHSFRTEASSWQLTKSETGNTLLRPKGTRRYVVTHREHKSQKTMGTNTIELDATVSRVLARYLPRIKERKHNYFLSTKDGRKLTASALSKLILRLTKSILGKSVGVRLARVLKTTQYKEQIKAVSDLAKEMGHTQKMQKSHVRN